jgi:Xaa-Pro aminopeptidase
MRYKTINPRFFTRNRRNFSAQLGEDSFAVFFSNDQNPRNGDQYHTFRQSSDFFYLTGIEQEKSILLIAPHCPNKNLKEALFLLESNEVLETWEGHKLTKSEASAISGVENVFWLEDFEASLREVMAYYNNVYLNSNEYTKFFPEMETREIRMGKQIREMFPWHHYHRAAPLLIRQRLIKSKEEIEVMQKACEITNKGFKRVLRTTRPGMYEYEVEAEITYEFIRNGASGHGYAPIVAAGKNACFLHYIENDKKCRKSDLLLLDIGAEYANYSADLSRTLPISGKFTKWQKQLYNAVLSVMKEIKKLYIPGSTINDINEAANLLMEAEMIKLGLFTADDVANQNPDKPLFKKYFMHGAAHFLGLDVHDVGLKTVPFEPGMVLTCEPGIYISEEGTGIRIENDILITDKDPVDLMADFPTEVEEIEALMHE